MALLGLLNTEDYASQRDKNIRRKVFYNYPNGAAPLTGLLSLMDGEETNDPEFNWWEKRLPQQTSTTAAVSGGNGPFAGSGAAVNNSWGSTLRTGGAGIDAGGATVVGEKISVKVADNTVFRPGHIVLIRGVSLNGGATHGFLRLRVGQLAATNFIDCYILDATSAGMLNNASTTNNSLEVLVVGNSFAQGSTGPTDELYALPINPANYTPIFRTPFSLTGTALKTNVKYDQSGPYKDKAKDHSIQHMRELEFDFLFGTRTKTTETDGRPHYTTGGILWYLEQWEKSGATSAIAYRGASAAALTADTDDEKRIITNSTGNMNEKTYDDYLERLFRVTNNKANEKLCLCGNGFLKTLNQMYKSKSTITVRQGSETTYGMTVVEHATSFGTVYYKTHPLFTQNPTMRYNGLFIDVQQLKYRYIMGRDTQLLKNRQNNGDDFRRDEWLSECGLEVQYPEAFMYMQNVTNYTP